MTTTDARNNVRAMPRPYNEEQLRIRKSLETEVRMVGNWYEMTASLGISELEQ
jgi:hypothetical protein